MLTDYEIKEMAKQLFDCLSLLRKVNKKIKNEKYNRRHSHKNKP